MKNLMILPAKDKKHIKLLKYPDDYDIREVYRYATGLIAQVEEDNPSYTWDDLAAVLEENGFVVLDYVLGPELGLLSGL